MVVEIATVVASAPCVLLPEPLLAVVVFEQHPVVSVVVTGPEVCGTWVVVPGESMDTPRVLAVVRAEVFMALEVGTVLCWTVAVVETLDAEVRFCLTVVFGVVLDGFLVVGAASWEASSGDNSSSSSAESASAQRIVSLPLGREQVAAGPAEGPRVRAVGAWAPLGEACGWLRRPGCGTGLPGRAAPALPPCCCRRAGLGRRASGRGAAAAAASWAASARLRQIGRAHV